MNLLHSLFGGMLIGAGAAVLLLGNREVAGISGIAANVLRGDPGASGWRLAFLVGLVAPAIVAGLEPSLMSGGSLATFAVSGLLVSGMADPANVLAFLDVGGDWNPALTLTMGGAIAVLAPVAWLLRRRGGRRHGGRYETGRARHRVGRLSPATVAAGRIGAPIRPRRAARRVGRAQSRPRRAARRISIRGDGSKRPPGRLALDIRVSRRPPARNPTATLTRRAVCADTALKRCSSCGG